jgi:hypothetical protein
MSLQKNKFYGMNNVYTNDITCFRQRSRRVATVAIFAESVPVVARPPHHRSRSHPAIALPSHYRAALEQTNEDSIQAPECCVVG